MNEEVKPITSADQAVAEFLGEQFIEWLSNYVAHEMQSWPELQMIAESKPKIEKIRKLFIQRHIAAQAFTGGREVDPGFLGFAIANLSESPDPDAESVLMVLEKKRLEENEGPTGSRALKKDHHEELWKRLIKALGATDEEINRADAKEWTRNYIAELSDLYTNGEWQEVAGAFTAHERAVPEEYRAFLALLRRNTELTDSQMEVLIWHSNVDTKYVINTGHILEKIVYDEENKRLVLQGVRRELEVRREFLSGLVRYLES